MSDQLKLSTEYGRLYNNAHVWLFDYLIGHPNIKSMVLGVSGGIDSALVAALARDVSDALQREQNRTVKVLGYSIPIESNKDDEISRASAVGRAFCHEFHQKDLTSLFYQVADEFPLYNSFHGDGYYGTMYFDNGTPIRRGNVKARLRMLFLYNEAHRHSGFVLSTDNLTEYYLGFWTLHGDVGDVGPIQSLWKTEVYGVAEYVANKLWNADSREGGIQADALRACIAAVPTDGLGISNSDLDQLGAPTYADVDNLLIRYLTCAETKEDVSDIMNHPVIVRYKNSEYKRSNPLNIKREELLLFGV